MSPITWLLTLPSRFAHRCACDEITGIMLTMERLPLYSAGYHHCLARWTEVEHNIDELQRKLREAGVDPTSYSLTDDEQIGILLALAIGALGATIYLSWV